MRARMLFSGVCVTGLWLSSCGAEAPQSGSLQSSPNPASTSSGANVHPAESAPTASPADEDNPILLPVGGASNGGTPPAPECQRDVYEAKPIELNLLLLLDLSGSMLGKVDADGASTQWDAVRDAIRTFVQSPQADGLGISLTYYPLLEERTACTTSAMCDDGTPCITAVCAPSRRSSATHFPA